MTNWGYERWVHCHWCGTSMKTARGDLKHHFCKNAHKMAHHRAYKKYVTQRPGAQAKSADKRVTPKKSGGRRGMIRSKAI